MNRIVEWIKLHKLVCILIVVLLYLVLRQPTISPLNLINTQSARTMMSGAPMMDAYDSGSSSTSGASFGMMAEPSFAPVKDYAPTPEVTNRMVVQNSSLSLLVNDVVSVRKQITDYATSLGGYMVSAETSNPQDAPTATVTVRVPSESLDSTLEKLRSLGVKVVSENLVGQDVTDQYVDIDARVATLEKTKSAMEDLLNRATLISDLTNITQQIISIQSQIDALKGQQKSLSENSKFAKVTVYLSTDEIALPYAPNDTFRPGVVFKLAVRALISTLRSLATTLIWVAVYGVIWIPVVIILFFINKYLRKR